MKDRRLVRLLGFYAQDIAALERLGLDVYVAHNIWQALRHLRRCDVFYGWWWHKSLVPVLAARAMRRPVFLTGALNATLKARHHRVRMLLSCVAGKLANGNLAISESEAKDLERSGFPNVRVVYPAVHVSDVTCPRTEHPTGVMVAQLNERSIARKGVDRAVDATSIVCRTYPEFEMHLVGPVSEDGRVWLMRNLAETGERVVVHGEVSSRERDQIVASSWMYVQPSRYEGFGLALAEGMALGAAPIGAATGSIPEVIGESGVILHNPSPEQLARAIVELIEDPDRLLWLQTAAKERAKRFDLDHRVEALRKVLEVVKIRS